MQYDRRKRVSFVNLDIKHIELIAGNLVRLVQMLNFVSDFKDRMFFSHFPGNKKSPFTCEKLQGCFWEI